MKVEYRCKGCALSDEHKQLIEDRVHRLSKYLGEVDRAEVFLERSSNPAQSEKVHAEITLRLAKFFFGHVKGKTRSQKNSAKERPSIDSSLWTLPRPSCHLP